MFEVHKALVPNLEFKARFLFYWTEDLVVSRSIYSLKNGLKSTSMYRYFAELIMISNFAEETFNHKIFVIPVPSKKQKRDHAYFLAKEISILIKGEFLEALNSQNESHQRFKTRAERSKTKYSLKFDFKFSEQDYKKSKILLIDDVITTASTIRSCRHALKKFINFEALSLAYRPKNRGSP